MSDGLSSGLLSSRVQIWWRIECSKVPLQPLQYCCYHWIEIENLMCLVFKILALEILIEQFEFLMELFSSIFFYIDLRTSALKQ
jgi:hypothetical protein